MQPETEEADVKVDGSVQKEVVQEESLNKERTTNEDPTDAPVEVSASDSKENVDNSEEKVTNVDENGIRNETESYNHSNQEKQDEEENELILTIDESPSKLTPDTKEEAIEEIKNAISNEDVPSESQTDTESYSVDIVESTTSEISETTESSSQNEVLKEKQIKSNDDVTYNSNIALKDVQIKLNDCLRDNLKQTNASGSERNTPEPLSKDMSFGKTLRNISGRSGLGRMRHNGPVERRFSPNNSLFVNTSSMSLPTEDGLDYKILHHRSGLSDSFSTNGSSTDKKRKLDLEESHSSKKQKIESESSFFNTSISLLKGLRKPIQVSTPNIGSYKFQSEKLNLSGLSNDGKQVTTETDGKKWCVIM